MQAGDALADEDSRNIGKIKLYTWRAHEFILNPDIDVAGVGWVLAEKWWPYQRPTFVTPPFPGYTSGHSAYSRAAAELFALLTGTPFFPGGLGEFHAPQNQYLVFEEGPSVDVTLQYATYRDASDQSSMSRIWGGIHPPADEIPSRHIGRTVGVDAFWHALDVFGTTDEAGLVVIGGNPGVGKTSLMAKVASKFFRKYPDKRVAIYSLEMILSEIAGRFKEVEKLTEEEEARIEINESPMTVQQVSADAATVDNIGLVMVVFADYMIRGETTESKMSEIYMTLATLAKQLHCPVFIVSIQ